MMANEKRRTIKDILGDLDMSEKTHSKNPGFSPKDKDDITGLEHQIPVVTKTGAIEEGPMIPMEETPPPIPKASLKEDTEPEIVMPIEVTQDFVTPQETNHPYAESWASTSSINKQEDFEQKIMKLETETRRQQDMLDAQKAEIEGYRTRIGDAEADNKKLRSELSSSESNVKINFEAQLNKAAIIEEKYRSLAKLHEEMKAKVRRDIRKIRTREKELANKLELMKNDSETLLAAKDHKILQLKQHIDNLEFEIENLKDRLVSLQEEAKESEEKAERVIKALRLSTSLLETSEKK
jgi:predicted  nucleic acid-binding Zn-ribbon protein